MNFTPYDIETMMSLLEPYELRDVDENVYQVSEKHILEFLSFGYITDTFIWDDGAGCIDHHFFVCDLFRVWEKKVSYYAMPLEDSFSFLFLLNDSALNELFDSGVISDVEAYLAGVPIEDILA